MKRLFVYASLLVVAAALSAQPAPPPAAPKPPPKSPPSVASLTIGGKAITINYSSPSVNGRAGHIFTKDGLISHNPHYPVWRAGANAATSLHTEADLVIGGLTVPSGDYTLFVDISDPDNWVLIISKLTGEWGLGYDPAKDLGRVKMTMSKPASLVENLAYSLTVPSENTVNLTLSWENYSASVTMMVH
jgi:hypothetical protein